MERFPFLIPSWFKSFSNLRKIKIAQQLSTKQRGEARLNYNDDEEAEENEEDDGVDVDEDKQNYDRKFGSTETIVSRYLFSQTDAQLTGV